ncbi:chromate efflux transporter [Microvirga sp. W0021]|uniref:Chromate efflux transporter n=1 Tax=Hohaiivirga grylli TaxID=3133970 RepID=A0ABV0BF41_9HYPH
MKSRSREIWDIFQAFLWLGLTSFGGPIAHLGYFRDEFVEKRKWLSDKQYADLVALCQFLPGPASSQVGMAIGLLRAEFIGSFAAWFGFTLPSALLMLGFAYGFDALSGQSMGSVLHGLKIVAVAVVAQAVWGMAKNLCPDRLRITIMVLVCSLTLLFPSAYAQIIVLFCAGIIGLILCKPERENVSYDALPVPYNGIIGLILLSIFFISLLGLVLAILLWPSVILAQIEAFYRSGAMIFGGGHVILPLLREAIVVPGWVDNNTFLAGYGIAQALPGPLTTFAAFLGASMKQGLHGWLGGLVGLIMIFIPSFLLVTGALPFWSKLQNYRNTRAALMGINAAVVGLLVAALYNPLWQSTILQPADFVLSLLAFTALVFWRVPVVLVVLLCGMGAWLITGII